jgi:TRAP-type C4-dicarboxylate transport system permease small subunit
MQAINTIFTNLLNIGVGVAVTVAAFYLMWGAYMYMTASGNPHKMESGKSAMTNVAVGLCIVLLARFLAQQLATAVGQGGA